MATHSPAAAMTNAHKPFDLILSRKFFMSLGDLLTLFAKQNPQIMKKLLLLPSIIALPAFAFGQTILISQNFDSFANGNLLAQTAGLPWSTWSDTPGGMEDTNISNEQASSGTLSAKFSGAPAGGPADMVLRLGDRTSGNYALGFNMYVTAGSGAYFNLQHNEVIGAGSWMMEMTFQPSGTLNFTLASGSVGTGTFPSGEWFTVLMLVNLDQQQASMLVNGTVQHSWQTNTPGPNRLGALNIFAYAGGAPATPSYFIDDVLFLDITGVGINETAKPEMAIYPSPTSDLITVEFAGTSSNAIASVLDLSGRTVIEGQGLLQSGTVSRTQVDLGNLPAGIYLLRVQDGERELMQRVTKY